MSFGPYCYYNNGVSMRAVPTGYVAQPGEVVFGDIATPTQLTAAFSGYAAAAAALEATAAVVQAMAAGINITSTSTPALDGTYDIGPNSQSNINATTTYILLNGTFPGGGTTQAWADLGGAIHIFPSIAEFKAFATAVANYVAAVQVYGDSGGTVGSLPSPNVTIA